MKEIQSKGRALRKPNKDAKVVELFPKPTEFTDDELRGFWNMFRTPQVQLPKAKKKK